MPHRTRRRIPAPLPGKAPGTRIRPHRPAPGRERPGLSPVRMPPPPRGKVPGLRRELPWRAVLHPSRETGPRATPATRCRSRSSRRPPAGPRGPESRRHPDPSTRLRPPRAGARGGAVNRRDRFPLPCCPAPGRNPRSRRRRVRARKQRWDPRRRSPAPRAALRPRVRWNQHRRRWGRSLLPRRRFPARPRPVRVPDWTSQGRSRRSPAARPPPPQARSRRPGRVARAMPVTPVCRAPRLRRLPGTTGGTGPPAPCRGTYRLRMPRARHPVGGPAGRSKRPARSLKRLPRPGGSSGLRPRRPRAPQAPQRLSHRPTPREPRQP